MDYDDDNADDDFNEEFQGNDDHNSVGSPMSTGDGDAGHDDQLIVKECLAAFSSPDFIIEPTIFSQLKRYFKAGGDPDQVVLLLSENYKATAQMVNVLAEWLVQSGVDVKAVQEIVESHLKEMIIRHFDPKKADSIFSLEGEAPSWLAEMIEYPTWRELFYCLAEQYPDCLMLNFTVKLISDAGHQAEIQSESTACHQIEVFSRVISTMISQFLDGGEEVFEKKLPAFAKMLCFSEHTYLYGELVMHLLTQEHRGGASVRRLCQEVYQHALHKNLDATPIMLALNGAAAYPRACQALSSMLSKGALNPADINVLYGMYNSPNPPPVDMIRTPHLLDLLTDSLFKPGTKFNSEHKPKYIYLLAYGACAVETWKKGNRKAINRDEVKPTVQALEKAHSLCVESSSTTELVADINTLFQCIKLPVVAMGVLKWISFTVLDASYFNLNTDHTPVHLVILDEIATHHTLLHQRIMNLLVSLFEATYQDLDVLVQLELKNTLLDRMVHLLSRGFVLPVISYVKSCYEKGDTDISLIRHFITEVLDIIGPPYTPEFVQSFLPLLENDDIVGQHRDEVEKNPVSAFIAYCRTNGL